MVRITTALVVVDIVVAVDIVVVVDIDRRCGCSRSPG